MLTTTRIFGNRIQMRINARIYPNGGSYEHYTPSVIYTRHDARTDRISSGLNCKIFPIAGRTLHGDQTMGGLKHRPFARDCPLQILYHDVLQVLQISPTARCIALETADFIFKRADLHGT